MPRRARPDHPLTPEMESLPLSLPEASNRQYYRSPSFHQYLPQGFPIALKTGAVEVAGEASVYWEWTPRTHLRLSMSAEVDNDELVGPLTVTSLAGGSTGPTINLVYDRLRPERYNL